MIKIYWHKTLQRYYKVYIIAKPLVSRALQAKLRLYTYTKRQQNKTHTRNSIGYKH